MQACVKQIKCQPNMHFNLVEAIRKFFTIYNKYDVIY